MVETRSKRQSKGGDNDEKKDKSDKKDSLFAKNQSLLDEYPVLINTIQGTILTALSVVTSHIVKGLTKGSPIYIDTREVIVMSVIQALWITPVLMWFYSKIINPMPGSNMRKLIIDQIAFSPPFTATIIGLRMFLMGKTPIDTIPAALYVAFPSAVGSSWLFWLPIRFMTISYIPPIYHLLAGSLFSFVWNVIFSLILG